MHFALCNRRKCRFNKLSDGISLKSLGSRYSGSLKQSDSVSHTVIFFFLKKGLIYAFNAELRHCCLISGKKCQLTGPFRLGGSWTLWFEMRRSCFSPLGPPGVLSWQLSKRPVRTLSAAHVFLVLICVLNLPNKHMHVFLSDVFLR